MWKASTIEGSEPRTIAQVAAHYADVLTAAELKAACAYIYTKRSQGPVTVVAKGTCHSERWYAEYLRMLGRGAPSSTLKAGKAVIRRVRAYMGPAGQAIQLSKDAWCEECGGTIRYSRLGDACCEDCGLVSGHPGIDEPEYEYDEGPNEVDYESIANVWSGARARNLRAASSLGDNDNGPHIIPANESHITEQKTIINMSLGGRLPEKGYMALRNEGQKAREVLYEQILHEIDEWEQANRGILPKIEARRGNKPENYNSVTTCREEGRLSVVIQHIKLAEASGEKLTAAGLVRITGLARRAVDQCIDVLCGDRARRRTGVCGKPRIRVVPVGRNKLLRLARTPQKH